MDIADPTDMKSIREHVDAVAANGHFGCDMQADGTLPTSHTSDKTELGMIK